MENANIMLHIWKLFYIFALPIDLRKTPVSEIEKAENIRKEYFKNKKQHG